MLMAQYEHAVLGKAGPSMALVQYAATLILAMVPGLTALLPLRRLKTDLSSVRSQRAQPQRRVLAGESLLVWHLCPLQLP